ncbi:MAG: DUF2125 domain-containing protein [Pseudobdellovibrionaceae bacterium]
MSRLIDRLGNLIIGIALCATLYLATWYGIGFVLKKQIEKAMQQSADNNIVFSGTLSGPVHFPLQFRYHYVGEIITPFMQAETGSLRLTSWFLPGNKIALDMPYGVKISTHNDKSVTLDRAHLVATFSDYPDNFTKAGMREWQKDGEEITISRFFIKSGDIFLKAIGEVHLDESLQPYTDVSMSVSGYAELLDRLVDEKLIKKDEARLAMSVLKVLEKTDASGRAWITAPLATQNGAAYLGPLRLGDLPVIEWRGE